MTSAQLLKDEISDLAQMRIELLQEESKVAKVRREVERQITLHTTLDGKFHLFVLFVEYIINRETMNVSRNDPRATRSSW